MLIQELKEILQDQAHIFQDAYFESSQIHQLMIIYCSEHTNNEFFISKSLQTFFACA